MIFEKAHERILSDLKEGLKPSTDLRFDADARLEVWVTMEDLEYRTDVEAIKKSTEADEIKKQKLQAIIIEVANTKLADVVRNAMGDVRITADLSWSNVNINRLDWHVLTTPEEEDTEDYSISPEVS